jgi:serine protease AprX
MAAPHVAGLAALLIEADPTLAGDVDRFEAIIQRTAVPLTTDEGCGGDTTTTVPNHTFGYGRIDALAAVNEALIAQLSEKRFFPMLVLQTE